MAQVVQADRREVELLRVRVVALLTVLLWMPKSGAMALTGRRRWSPMPNDWNGPGFGYEMVPLAPAERSRAEIRLTVTEEELLGFEPSNTQAMMGHSLRLRRQVSAFRPGTEGWAHPRAESGELRVWGDRPATALAYRWLWEDLHALRMVKPTQLIDND
jgi:hypothetical protein